MALRAYYYSTEHIEHNSCAYYDSACSVLKTGYVRPAGEKLGNFCLRRAVLTDDKIMFIVGHAFFSSALLVGHFGWAFKVSIDDRAC